ncbi:hypothetical protein KO489_04635 [Reinekea forsetii]|nr:hypothetical protein [Reinekea forsetii]
MSNSIQEIANIAQGTAESTNVANEETQAELKNLNSATKKIESLVATRSDTEKSVNQLNNL